MENVYPDPSECAAKLRIGDRLFEKKFDTWDYQWAMAKAYNNSLTIIPARNQILNIGFDTDATHTQQKPGDVPTMQFDLPSGVRHPHFVIPDRVYDQSYAEQKFGEEHLLVRVLRRVRSLLSI